MQKWTSFQLLSSKVIQTSMDICTQTVSRRHRHIYPDVCLYTAFDSLVFSAPSGPLKLSLKVWFYLFRNGLKLTGRVSLTERRTNRWQRTFYVSSALLGRRAGISQIITPTSKISQLNRNWTILFIQPQGLALKTTQLFEIFFHRVYFSPIHWGTWIK